MQPVAGSRSKRVRSLVVLGALICALALAACGSSAKPSGLAAGGSKSYSSFLKFSECMRSHGLTNFPDPGPNGGIQLSIGPGSSSTLNPQSPAFQSAQQACHKLLPGGGPSAHPISAAQRAQLIANAQCMRSHGVPNFPDPTFSGGATKIGIGSGVDPRSPAFEAAAKACGGPGGKGAVSVQAAP